MPSPSNIRDIVLASQAVIDKAVATVQSTTKTQALLQQDISIATDTVFKHNASNKSHDDLRKMISALGTCMVSVPEVTGGPTVAETGTEQTWNFAGLSNMKGVDVIGFEVIDNYGNKFQVEADKYGHATFTHAFTGERNTEIEFLVCTLGTADAISNPAYVKLFITHHIPPLVDEATYKMPTRLSYGKRYPFSISNLEDMDGDLTRIEIISDTPGVTFSQSDNLEQGVDYEIIVAPDCKGPGNATITFRAHDDYGLHADKAFVIEINEDPVEVALAHNFPTWISRNRVVPIRISGISDPNGDEITFDISSSLEGMTFPKSTGIKLNEEFNLITGDVTPGDPYTITIVFKDPYGGSLTKTISSTINMPPDVSALYADKPDFVVPGRTHEIAFHGVTDANGEAITYEIDNDNPGFTFSKVIGILEGEKIQFTVDTELASAARGAAWNISVYARDSEQNRSLCATIPVKINRLPSTEISHTLPEGMIPLQEVTCQLTSPDKDADDSQVTYTVTADHGVTIQNGENIHVGDSFTFSMPDQDEIPRYEYLTITITATDGLETATTSHKIQSINRAPYDDGFTHTMLPKYSRGRTFKLKANGIADLDGDIPTYSIASSNTHITFSKTEGIALDEEIDVIVSNTVPYGADYTFTFTFVDGHGGSIVKQVSSSIDYPPNVSALTVDKIVYYIPGKAYEIAISGATDVENEDITYEIVNPHEAITFSKTTGILANEKVTITFAADALHGNTYNIQFGARDSELNLSDLVTVGFRTNNLTEAALTHDVPPVCVPGRSYSCKITGPTQDQDAHPIRFTITTDQAGVVLSNAVDIAPNDTWAFTMASVDDLPRGNTFTFDVALFDGYETVHRTITVQQHRLANMADAKISFSQSQNAEYGWVTGQPTSATDALPEKMYGSVYTWSIGVVRLNDPDSGVALKHRVIAVPQLNVNSSGFGAQNTSDSTSYSCRWNKVSSDTPVTLTVEFTDSFGEVQTKVLPTTIIPRIVTAEPSPASLPSTGSSGYPDRESWSQSSGTVPHYQSFSLSFSSYSEATDMNNDKTYPYK